MLQVIGSIPRSLQTACQLFGIGHAGGPHWVKKPLGSGESRSTGMCEVNILPRLASYLSSPVPLSALECDGGRFISIDNSNL